MASISQTLEKVSIPVRATDILRWSRMSAVDTARHGRRRFDDEKLLELDKVMPVVAEVVDVDELDIVASAEIEELHLRHPDLRAQLGLASAFLLIRVHVMPLIATQS
jgi:hypothetical protein